MLKGRLGLETARVPHADRHGLIWLSRGALSVENGCLRFAAADGPDMKAGLYDTSGI
jgi:CRISP-associated protein Cas1